MAPNSKCVIFFSRDYGGVLTILPVVKELLVSSEPIKFVVIADKATYKLFQAEGVEVKVASLFDNKNEIEDFLYKIIQQNRPELIVTGTSRIANNEKRTPEQYLIKIARNTGIKTISILDFWGVYKERFPSSDGQLMYDFLPDIVCCLDKQCENDLLSLGIPRENLKITHNPHLDKVISLVKSKKLEKEDVHKFNVLYVSQPIREYGSAESLGFDQESNFLELLNTFNGANWIDKEVTIYLWVHPKEFMINWRLIIDQTNKKFKKNNRLIRVVNDTKKNYDIFYKLNLTCSYYSTVIYDALYFNVPCLSLSIGSKIGKNTRLITNQLGLSISISTSQELDEFINQTDFQKLKNALHTKISKCVEKKVFFSDGFATRRVVKVINNILKK